MALTEYNSGQAFSGVIGRTFDVSQPAWPAPDGSLDFTQAGKSGANSAIFNLVQSATGTALIDSGVLALQGGLSSIAGTIGGANTLADPVAGVVKFLVNGQATLEATAVLDVDAFEVSGTGSRVTVNGDRAFGGPNRRGGVSKFLDLNGHTSR